MKLQWKNKKLLWLLPLAALIAAGAVSGGVWLLAKRSGNPVKVYEFNLVGMDTYWGDEKSSNGIVHTDGLQTVPLSDTQEVTEILVAEGDTVRKGDVLMTYDTTLSELDLERKRLAVEKAKLDIDVAKAELADINALKPIEDYGGDTGSNYEPLRVDYLLSTDFEEFAEYDGSSVDKAVIIWMRESAVLSSNLIAQIQAATGNSRIYFIVKKTYDNLYGSYSCFQGVYYPDGIDGMYFFDGTETGDYMYSDFVEENSGSIGTYYSQKEINKMRKEKQREIITLNEKLVTANNEYNLAQLEAASGQVVAKLDGKVISVLSVDDAKEKKQPIIKVSGGGGYTIKGSVSELEREQLAIGSMVSINDWTNGGYFEGTVTSIGSFPTSSGSYSGSGNPNVSYYPFTVSVDESADLIADIYVSLSYTLEGSSDSLYLQTPFVRQDDSGSYCYVQGANGRLEKRTVTTGKILWGAYLEIKSGLSKTDYVAFPYGDNVKSGAKTEVGDMSALYS